MINSIDIKNFKCFLDNRINFNKLTVFAGGNAVGKSTTIQSLLLIRQTVDKYIFRGSDSPSKHIALNGEYCLELGNSTEVLTSYAKDEEIEFNINESDIGSKFTYIANRNSSDIYLEFKENQMYSGDCSIMHKEFHYLNAERIGPRSMYNMNDHNFYNTGYKGENTAFVISKLYDKKIDKDRRIKNEEQLVPNLNKQIEYWMNYIIPGIEINTTMYNDINVVRMGLRRKYSETNFLNPNNIGFGISYVLPIIVSGLIADKGSMLIVENPESHLHPSGQSKVGQFLAQIAQAGVQVVIETHSEHVINGIRIAIMKNMINNENVIINFLDLDRNQKGILVDCIELNEFAELNKWPKGFFDQEEDDLRELFLLKRGRGSNGFLSK